VRRRGVRLGVALGLIAIAGVLLTRVLPHDYARIQGAGGEEFRAAVRPIASKFISAAKWDNGYAVLYGILGAFALCTMFGYRRHRDGRSWRVMRWLGPTLILGAAAADFGENCALIAAAGRLNHASPVQFNDMMRSFNIAKNALFGATALLLIVFFWTFFAPGKPKEFVDGDSKDRPNPPCTWPRSATWGDTSWDPPRRGTERRGICCSGGGIRSAAFSLGVLQALQENGTFSKTKYLAAVSGGGYIAAGLAVNQPLEGVPEQMVPFSQGSKQERYFRDHSSYLIPNLRGGAAAVGTLVAGLLINMLVLWLALNAVARPVGWAISAIHPELKAKQPVALVDDAKAEIAIWYVERDPHEPSLFIVHIQPAGDACMDVEPFRPDKGDFAFTAREVAPAIVEIADGVMKVRRQPQVTPEPAPYSVARCMPDASANKQRESLLGTLKVTVSPLIAANKAAFATGVTDLASQLTVKRHPVILPIVGLRGRPSIAVKGWMWPVSLAVLGAGILIAFITILLRLPGSRRTWFLRTQFVLAGAGLIAFALTIALPYMTHGFPETTARLFRVSNNTAEGTTGWEDTLVPGGGFAFILLFTLRRFFTSNQSTEGAKAAPGSRIGKLLKKIGKDKLRWYELSPAKIIAGIVMVVVPFVLFLQMLVYSSANGIGGHLMGFAFIRKRLPWVLWLPEWERWVLVAIFLLLVHLFVDGHSWSLHPFYKRRLSDAYQVVSGKTYDSAPVQFDQLVAEEEGFPQLILCAAVNLSEAGVTPPARRAASFTFSSTEIGGPLVGYMPTKEYWYRMGKARQKDITVPAAMSISGAAFSPAMGKFNNGPVGSIYAVANLRLGVWLPHPQYVEAMPPRETWRHRPSWDWFIREVAGRYHRHRPYLYVSDGGHWENLGLVELLRRGCTEIICVNAGGDRQDSFDTIGQAMALAREELGVEFELDPSDLRPLTKAAEDGRLLRRVGSRSEPTPLATAGHVMGRFSYHRPDGTKRTGKIWLIEPALTNDMPFDVHAYAESESSFPDIPTGDQIFNHMQFEAYRALGHHQGSAIALPHSPGASTPH
jgi:patatin-like phospholipase